MKSEQASILGKLRRQMAQPPDSPFQRPSRPAVTWTSASKPPPHLGTWDRATPLPGQPRPHSVTSPALRPRPFPRAAARQPRE